MRTFLRRATLVALVTTFAFTSLSALKAQPIPSRSSAPGAVAVVDISRIFKNHIRFKRMMEDMRRDVEQVETSIRAERQAMADAITELRTYKPGSPTYMTKEEEIAKRESDLRLKMELQKRDFMETEARNYYNIYREVTSVVKLFAQRHGIALVMRYNSTEINPDNRTSVLQGVNRAVVYQNGIDITEDILMELNRGTRVGDDNNLGQRPRDTIPNYPR